MHALPCGEQLRGLGVSRGCVGGQQDFGQTAGAPGQVHIWTCPPAGGGSSEPLQFMPLGLCMGMDVPLLTEGWQGVCERPQWDQVPPGNLPGDMSGPEGSRGRFLLPGGGFCEYSMMLLAVE